MRYFRRKRAFRSRAVGALFTRPAPFHGRRREIGRWRTPFPLRHFGCVDDGFRKSLRPFLRQVVADAAADGPVFISAREFCSISARLRMRGAVRIAFKGDGRNRDDRR
jgi:hypothetical protein